MRDLVCIKCQRRVVCDDISDGPYLASQYGWQMGSAGVKCPICVYGINKGQKLINYLNAIRAQRIDAEEPE